MNAETHFELLLQSFPFPACLFIKKGQDNRGPSCPAVLCHLKKHMSFRKAMLIPWVFIALILAFPSARMDSLSFECHDL